MENLEQKTFRLILELNIRMEEIMLKKLIISFLIVLGFTSLFPNQYTVLATEDGTISEV